MTLLARKLRKALKQISERGRTAYVCVLGSPAGPFKVFHEKGKKKKKATFSACPHIKEGFHYKKRFNLVNR